MEAARRAAGYVLPSSRTLVALAAAAERKRIKEKMAKKKAKWKKKRPVLPTAANASRRPYVMAQMQVQRTMPALGDAVDFGIDVDSDHPAIMAVRADATMQDMIRRDLDRISDRLALDAKQADSTRIAQATVDADNQEPAAAAAAAAEPMDLQILVPIPPIAAIPLGQAHPSPGTPIRPLDGPGLSPQFPAMCPQQPVPDTDHDAVLDDALPAGGGAVHSGQEEDNCGEMVLEMDVHDDDLDGGGDNTGTGSIGDGRMISGFRRAVDGEQTSPPAQKEPRKRGRAKTTGLNPALIEVIEVEQNEREHATEARDDVDAVAAAIAAAEEPVKSDGSEKQSKASVSSWASTKEPELRRKKKRGAQRNRKKMGNVSPVSAVPGQEAEAEDNLLRPNHQRGSVERLTKKKERDNFPSTTPMPGGGDDDDDSVELIGAVPAQIPPAPAAACQAGAPAAAAAAPLAVQPPNPALQQPQAPPPAAPAAAAGAGAGAPLNPRRTALAPSAHAPAMVVAMPPPAPPLPPLPPAPAAAAAALSDAHYGDPNAIPVPLNYTTSSRVDLMIAR